MPLAEFELTVLVAVLALSDKAEGKPGAYAVSVQDEIHRRTGRRASAGAVYVTLDRLESKGLLRSRLGEPTAARGGRAKRFYALTKPGVAALRAERRIMRGLWDGLEPLVD